MVDGRFAVDATSPRTELKPSRGFENAYRLPPDQVEARLLETLDRLLAQTDKAAVFGGATCAPASAAEKTVCDAPDLSWAEASTLFAGWITERYPEYDAPDFYLADLLKGQLLGRVSQDPKLQSLLTTTALQRIDAQPQEDTGLLDFVVRPPISAAGIKACETSGDDCPILLRNNAEAFEGQVSRPAMARALKPLRGEVWDLDRIRRQLGDLLGLVGFRVTSKTPADEVDEVVLQGKDATTGQDMQPPPDASARVVIDGPARVSVIQFGFPRDERAPDDKTTADVAAERAAAMKVLYLLLPDDAFRAVRAHPDWLETIDGAFASGAAARFHILRLTEHPPWNQGAGAPYSHRMRTRLAAITPLGFAANLASDAEPPADGAWARVQLDRADDASAPKAESDGKSDGEGKPAAATKNGAPVPIAPRHTLLIGGGDEAHRPAEAFIEYSQARLLGDDAITVRAGTRGKTIISGLYEKDFVNFAGIGRRLTLSVQGASDYTPEIPDGATRKDERRVGGSVAASLQLFRDLDDQSLRLNATLGYEDVSTDAGTGAPAQPATRISHATLGAAYAWIGGDTLNRPNLAVEPSLTAAWGDGATPSYWKGALRGVLHDKFETFFEYDARVALDRASDRTPVTERPRLGGAESLRGLRSDAASGTFVWSVQNELWIPLRFADRLAPGVDAMLRDKLKLAAFVDMGGASRNQQELPKLNVGVGLGLRFTPNDAMSLRLDWARLATRSPHGMSDQSVYFSIIVIPYRD